MEERDLPSNFAEQKLFNSKQMNRSKLRKMEFKEDQSSSGVNCGANKRYDWGPYAHYMDLS